MKTTELIEFLQKHQYGGATGRPREVYICVDDEIYETEIKNYSTGDGLVTELYITLAESETDEKGKQIKLINLDEAIDAIDSTDWYHINDRGELSEGAEGDESALYKATDIYKAIGEVPVVDAIPVSFIQQEIDGYYKDEAVTVPNTMINWVIRSKRLGLQYLIERWKKEQEKQNETD